MKPAARKQRNYRWRRACGQRVLPVTVDEVALAEALADVGLIHTCDPTPAELAAALTDLVRALIEQHEERYR
jgi:hypothetical protein